ncbi:MAG: 2-phospho-L-lactate guanylyltransferase [Chloroflexota bacterium]
MKIWAIIPVKTLSKTKTRLASVLLPNERANLTLKLLKRLLFQIDKVASIDRAIVVSRDERVCQLALAPNQSALSEPEGEDLNGSVSFAFKYAQQAGVTHCLILPSDLPLVEAADLDLFLSQIGKDTAGKTALICSDAIQMGTNALLLPTNKPFQFRYGPNSYEQHLEEMQQRGLNPISLFVPNIQFDLDNEADWQKYQLYTL